jgi:hypothetical protein
LTAVEGSGDGAPVSWERRLLDLFEDLELQAEGAALRARDAEVAELSRSEYSEIDLSSRWHASIGATVELTLGHGVVVRGRLARVGNGWCLVVEPSLDGQPAQEWLVGLPGVVAVRGLSPQARLEPLRPATGRLGMGSVLRSLAEEQEPVTLVRADGELRRGRVGRVGRDFLELLADGGVEVVPFSAAAAVRR